MTMILHSEEPHEGSDAPSAEAIADAIVDAQEEAREELEQQAEVEAASQTAEAALTAAYDHSHPEADLSPLHSRLDDQQMRLERIEALLVAQATPPEPEVEVVEPSADPPAESASESAPPSTSSRHGLRRGA